MFFGKMKGRINPLIVYKLATALVKVVVTEANRKLSIGKLRTVSYFFD